MSIEVGASQLGTFERLFPMRVKHAALLRFCCGSHTRLRALQHDVCDGLIAREPATTWFDSIVVRAAFGWIEVVRDIWDGGLDAHEGHFFVAIAEKKAKALVVPVRRVIGFKIVYKYFKCSCNSTW
jgi:hypothetical protein